MTGNRVPFSESQIRWLIRPLAAILLILFIWGCGAVPELQEGSEGAFVRLPFVRILIENNSKSITVTCGTQFSLECTKNNKSMVYQTAQPITFRQERGRIAVTTSRNTLGDGCSDVVVMPRSNKSFLNYEGKRYRGMFKVVPNGSNLRLINIVHIDDYLKGVVPPEIGFVEEDAFEAIKAQAVAARTYAMSHLSQYSGEPFDMKADISDQVYDGIEVEQPIVSRAVDETSGYVAKYHGDFINAYYHSTCGGYTDDIDAVWNKPPEPYLRAVNDSGYCSWSKYYNWEESYTADQLKMLIEQFLSAERGRVVDIGNVLDLRARSNTAGGRIAELVVETGRGNYSFKGDRIRWVIRRSSNPEMILESARFKIIATHDSTSGKLIRVDLDGGGYGHGVGMCQCGALGMARAGWDYNKILKHYYRGIDIVKLY